MPLMGIDTCVILPEESFVSTASAGLPTRKVGTVPTKLHQSGTDKIVLPEFCVINITEEKSCTHVLMLGSEIGGGGELKIPVLYTGGSAFFA